MEGLHRVWEVVDQPVPAVVIPWSRLLVQGWGRTPSPGKASEAQAAPSSTHPVPPPRLGIAHALSQPSPETHTRVHTLTHSHPPASAPMNLLSSRASLHPLPALSPHLLTHKVIGMFSLLITSPPTIQSFQFCPLASPRGLEHSDPQRMLRQYRWGVRPDAEINTPT